ncbi:hypothetical protein Pint_21427 [Pistacia integerrima]|uniref:Uncharacterized protein n=1 Tax=Pistacia integerrima TaxID=434235 RepID=A0ACC0XAF0_9ROSI|nr:hypothetical protein Pint_21427 [Pistacia integerrima]
MRNQTTVPKQMTVHLLFENLIPKKRKKTILNIASSFFNRASFFDLKSRYRLSFAAGFPAQIAGLGLLDFKPAGIDDNFSGVFLLPFIIVGLGKRGTGPLTHLLSISHQ